MGRTYTLTLVTLLGVLSNGCGRVSLEPDPAARGSITRGELKSDGTNSCKGVCGGQAASGCWCDAECVKFGDCCQDKGPVCDRKPLTCEGSCGKQAPTGCWCDAECARYGDCCPDKAAKCDAKPKACNTLLEPACVKRSDCEWLSDAGTPGTPSPSGGGVCRDKGFTCGQAMCEMYCPNGFVKDKNGCEICQCKPSACTPQDAVGEGLCEMFIGYFWNGKACVGQGGCSCKGKDCGKAFQDQADCEKAYASCGSCVGAHLDANGVCKTLTGAAAAESCCDVERQQKCSQIDQDYGQALQAARNCSPFVTMVQCTTKVNSDLICPCPTFVQDASKLKPAQDAWKKFGCAQGMQKGWWGCPAVMCPEPTKGACEQDPKGTSGGRCKDV
ncbi:MAG: hypothetical protein IT371_05940 [Deltaproteobacteria bacterium]|nr:hypothetical protein [Deltaproteobacteria bacterium]